MKEVRIGIVGVGGIGNHHLGYMHKLEGARLTALADARAEVLEKALEKARAKNKGVEGFATHRRLIASNRCDAVLIATPHRFHPIIAIDAFKKGLHVLTEKPLAVDTKSAKQAIAAWKKAKGLVYAAMFQQRTEPLWRRAKEIVAGEALGELSRASWTMTAWFRSQAYYDSGGWRATWSGEGGGALLNQCPHTLDLFAWLAGMPSRVLAQCALGKHHRIEVEDEVNALLEYPNGAIGNFITSTAEAPGVNRLEIVGDRGTMIVENGRIQLKRCSGGSVRRYLETSTECFKGPEFVSDEITVERQMGSAHQAIAQNFVNAIRRKTPLVAPAEEGLRSLALGNAILMSGVKRKPVDIPFNDNEYARMIAELASRSSKGGIVA